jgi:hypothetical protein
MSFSRQNCTLNLSLDQGNWRKQAISLRTPVTGRIVSLWAHGRKQSIRFLRVPSRSARTRETVCYIYNHAHRRSALPKISQLPDIRPGSRGSNCRQSARCASRRAGAEPGDFGSGRNPGPSYSDSHQHGGLVQVARTMALQKNAGEARHGELP